MPSDDYAPIVRGGLKLKGGAKPTGVTKTKKKKKNKKPEGKASSIPQEDASLQDGKEKEVEEDGEGDVDEAKLRELDPRGDDGKTASEREYEEMRRKRLQDRLTREGVKTHKERVEELNKYLSTLSEHHDMPRIGPG